MGDNYILVVVILHLSRKTSKSMYRLYNDVAFDFSYDLIFFGDGNF